MWRWHDIGEHLSRCRQKKSHTTSKMRKSEQHIDKINRRGCDVKEHKHGQEHEYEHKVVTPRRLRLVTPPACAHTVVPCMREGREEDDGKEIRLAFEEESSVGMKVEDIKKREKENGVGVSFLKEETLELIFRASTT